MKTKRGLIILFLLIGIILATHFIVAQEQEVTTQNNPQASPDQQPENNALPSTAPQVPSAVLGEINPQTGKPKNLETLQKYGDYFKEREQNKDFLKQGWGILLAENKFFGPFLFYTEQFFSLFNFFWKAIFGIEFSWSWAFLLSFGMWIMFIILIFWPAKGLLQNKLLDLIVAFLIASLIGTAGTIEQIVTLITPIITNIYALITLIVLLIIVMVLYIQIWKNILKRSEELEVEQAKENIKAEGKVARRGLREFSN
ncbi:MAG: hypothetical protein RL557_786 [archaeon]|jgi:hypothetical protein